MRAFIALCVIAAGVPLLPQPSSPDAAESLQWPEQPSGVTHVRRINDASRGVHSPEECYRATGWQIRPRPLQIEQHIRWGCFEAKRGKEKLEVCHSIVDGHGASWSDNGSWWWAALLKRTGGPWLALIRVAAMPQRPPAQ